MSSTLSPVIAVVVVDDLLHRSLTALEAAKCLATTISGSMAKSRHQRLDPLEGQRPCSHTRRRLHGIPEKSSSSPHRRSIPAAHRRILRISLLRRITLLRCITLLRRRWWRRGSRGLIPSQQGPQKTRRTLRLRMLLHLLDLSLRLRQLRLSLLQG